MATVIAALVAKARRDIQHYFFQEDAVRPERAVRFEPNSRIQERQFDLMRSRGIIQEAKPGYFWVDIPKYDSELRRRLTRLRWALLVALFALLIAALMGAFAAG